jgi:hypothetical protein
VRAQECGQPCEPRRRPGIGRPGTGRRGHAESLAGTGFGGTGFPRRVPGVLGSTNAKSNAVPPDLAELVAVWRRLPDTVRAGIVAMERASGA